MSLKFLLDEHLSTKVMDVLGSLEAPFETMSVLTLDEGSLRGEFHDSLLAYCKKHDYILVSADLNTIPPLLKSWMDQGLYHSGVVFISNKSMPTNQYARIAKSLLELASTHDLSNGINQVYFLK